jgi:hypothetical protein
VGDERLCERRGGVLGHVERARERGQDELGIAKRRERDPVDPVGVAIGGEAGRLQGKARLPGAARAGEGEQARSFEERHDLGELGLPAEEGRRRHREVRAVEALEGREVSLAQLVDPLGGGEVLEPVLAEIAQLDLDQWSCRGRDEDLTSVAAGGDAGCPVDVVSDVALLGEERRAGVQAHPDLDRTRGERLGEGSRRSERIRRGPEGEEEGVALRVHLDPALAGAGLPDQAPVLGERRPPLPARAGGGSSPPRR